jgi:hypothetical protein
VARRHDGDGRIEIALGSLAGELVVLEARGDDFVETTRQPFFGRIANAITGAHLGDADGDGRPEFGVCAVGAILNREQRPTLGIFEADGDDRYAVAGRFEFTDKNIPYDNALAAGDVDGDGDPELALAYSGHVYLFDSDQDGRYLPSWYVPRAGGGRLMVVDLDGDGMAEILVAERTAEGPVTTVYGRASTPPPAALSWQAIRHPLGNEIRWQVTGGGARVFDLALYRLEAGEVPGIESDLASRRIHQHPGELIGDAAFRDAERPPGSTRYLVAYTAVTDDAGDGEIRRRVLEGPVVAGSVAGVPALLLSAPYPNPARGPVTLTLALAGPGAVAVTVYDVSGRAQRQLWSGALPAGPHRLAWDGRDDQGRRVASGIYFVGARSPLGETSARLVLLWR